MLENYFKISAFLSLPIIIWSLCPFCTWSHRQQKFTSRGSKGHGSRFLNWWISIRLVCFCVSMKPLHGYTWQYMANMGIYGNTWLYMVIHGYTWLYMGIQGIKWLYMAIHGNTWLYKDIYGYTWFYMAIHIITWVYMAIHGYTWQYMVIHGYTWHYMVLHGYTWLFLCISW